MTGLELRLNCPKCGKSLSVEKNLSKKVTPAIHVCNLEDDGICNFKIHTYCETCKTEAVIDKPGNIIFTDDDY